MPEQTIVEAVGEIDSGRYRVPSIQRSFVWKSDQVYKFMDSLMRDYPIGSLLLWKPGSQLPIRTRRFVREHKSNHPEMSGAETLEQGSYLVLDGQQRLQSLYLAFRGTYDGKRLHFKVDSSPADQDSDAGYEFTFLAPEEVSDSTWRLVSELEEIKVPNVSKYVESHFPSHPNTVKEVIKTNLLTFLQMFKITKKLSLQHVAEELTYQDVLEVFIRVNSGGTVLKKADLLRSFVIMNSPTMERNFRELVDHLNGNGAYDFDIAFLIKTSFVLFDFGAKNDLTKVKTGDFIQRLDQDFNALRTALFSTVEFLRNDARIFSKRFLRSYSALTPIIDYIYRQPRQQIPDDREVFNLRQYLHMSLFLNFYSYGVDSKLDVIHKKIVASKNVFPVCDIGQYMGEGTKTGYEFTEEMLNDAALVLNVIQNGVSEITNQRGWSLERDHIFPNSVLTKLGVPDQLKDAVGNLRYLGKARNILKSANIPESTLEYYGSDREDLHSLFVKARQDLSVESFTAFCTVRQRHILEKVRSFLGFGPPVYGGVAGDHSIVKKAALPKRPPGRSPGPRPVVGKIFGKLTVLENLPRKLGGQTSTSGEFRNRSYYRSRCRCECGNECEVLESLLRHSKNPSCGCAVHHFTASDAVHGYTRKGKETPEHKVWQNLKRKRYGGREIGVCERWQEFSVFLSDVGNRPSPAHNFNLMDKNGKFEPGNVKWLTVKQQNRIRSNNRSVTLQGETRCFSEWCEIRNVRAATINSRTRQGYSLEEAFDERFQQRHRKSKSRVLVGARQAAATFGGNFKAKDVLDVMIENGFAFGTKNPTSAVNRALRRLSKANEIRIAVRTTGSNGNQYTRIAKDTYA